MSDWRQLPRVSSYRAHRFFDLPGRDVDVHLRGRSRPLRLHCRMAGHGDPILLVHGLMTSGYSWRYVIEPLAAHYRVIVPDLPGAGRSDAPVDLSMDPRSTASVLSGLLDALELDTAYVVGNSLGGYQTLWFALLHPRKIRRLVVIHAPGFPQVRLYALHSALGIPGIGSLYRRFVRSPENFAVRNVHYHHDEIHSQEEALEYGAVFHDDDRFAVFLRILREAMNPRVMTRLAARLREARDYGSFANTRLFWSRQDVLVPPAFGPRYQELLPDAELIWFDEASHFLHVDQPERTVAEICRFDGR